MPRKKNRVIAAEYSARAKYRKKRYRDKGDTDSMHVIGAMGCWCGTKCEWQYGGEPHPRPERPDAPLSKPEPDGFIPLSPQEFEKSAREQAKQYGDIVNKVMWE